MYKNSDPRYFKMVIRMYNCKSTQKMLCHPDVPAADYELTTLVRPPKIDTIVFEGVKIFVFLIDRAMLELSNAGVRLEKSFFYLEIEPLFH